MDTHKSPLAGGVEASAGAAAPGRPRAGLLIRLYRSFTGYGFAVLLIGLLFLLTFLGTLEQRDTSLFEVQRKYFESLYLMQDLGPAESTFERTSWLIGMAFLDLLLIGTLRGLTRILAVAVVSAFVLAVVTHGLVVPLPGAALVMACFFVNLVLGGIIRIRKRKATMGVIIAHVGILLMLLSGLVEYAFSTKGHMTLVEGRDSDEYVSFNEWEVVVFENGNTTEFVVPADEFIHNREEEQVTYQHPALPFQFRISSVMKNSRVAASAARPGDDPGGATYRLVKVKQETEAELDVVGCVITAWSDPSRKDAKSGILWGNEALPFTYEAGGKLWLAHIQRRAWKVPFSIQLDDARMEEHPGTFNAAQGMGMARAYESDVTMTEAGRNEKILISMNEPLRHKGFTFFQTRMGMTEARQPFSQFSVVKNPADAWPLYACYVIAAGLLLHFIRKLSLFVNSIQGRGE